MTEEIVVALTVKNAVAVAEGGEVGSAIEIAVSDGRVVGEGMRVDEVELEKDGSIEGDSVNSGVDVSKLDDEPLEIGVIDTLAVDVGEGEDVSDDDTPIPPVTSCDNLQFLQRTALITGKMERKHPLPVVAKAVTQPLYEQHRA